MSVCERKRLILLPKSLIITTVDLFRASYNQHSRAKGEQPKTNAHTVRTTGALKLLSFLLQTV